ncbi:hypothetical protein Emed_006152 [Eimeria media]
MERQGSSNNSNMDVDGEEEALEGAPEGPPEEGPPPEPDEDPIAELLVDVGGSVGTDQQSPAEGPPPPEGPRSPRGAPPDGGIRLAMFPLWRGDHDNAPQRGAPAPLGPLIPSANTLSWLPPPLPPSLGLTGWDFEGGLGGGGGPDEGLSPEGSGEGGPLGSGGGGPWSPEIRRRFLLAKARVLFVLDACASFVNQAGHRSRSQRPSSSLTPSSASSNQQQQQQQEQQQQREEGDEEALAFGRGELGGALPAASLSSGGPPRPEEGPLGGPPTAPAVLGVEEGEGAPGAPGGPPIFRLRRSSLPSLAEAEAAYGGAGHLALRRRLRTALLHADEETIHCACYVISEQLQDPHLLLMMYCCVFTFLPPKDALRLLLPSLSAAPTLAEGKRFIGSLSSFHVHESRCGQVWDGEHVAYRCLTCGGSQSSCICVACFQGLCFVDFFGLCMKAGQHEGHSYFIYRSACGGCCDCGDASAWAPSGFCSRHAGGARASDPVSVLPQQTQVLLLLLLRAAARQLVAFCGAADWERVRQLALGLRDACSLHEAFRRCCGRAFLEELQGSSPPPPPPPADPPAADSSAAAAAAAAAGDVFSDDSLPLQQRLNAAPCYLLYEGLEGLSRSAVLGGVPGTPAAADVGYFNPLDAAAVAAAQAAEQAAEEEAAAAATAAAAAEAAAADNTSAADPTAATAGGLNDPQDWEAEEKQIEEGADLLGLVGAPTRGPPPSRRGGTPFSYVEALRNSLTNLSSSPADSAFLPRARRASPLSAAAARAAAAEASAATPTPPAATAAATAAAAAAAGDAAAADAAEGGGPDFRHPSSSDSIPAERLSGDPPGGPPSGGPLMPHIPAGGPLPSSSLSEGSGGGGEGGPCACAVLLRRAHGAPKEAHGALTTLWLTLMFDGWFKEKFAVVFLQQYDALVLVGDPALERVTVQVLSIRALLQKLLRLGLLLPQLFACRLALQQAVSFQGLPPFCVEVRHAFLKRRTYVNALNDVRYLLAEKALLCNCKIHLLPAAAAIASAAPAAAAGAPAAAAFAAAGGGAAAAAATTATAAAAGFLIVAAFAAAVAAPAAFAQFVAAPAVAAAHAGASQEQHQQQQQ